MPKTLFICLFMLVSSFASAGKDVNASNINGYDFSIREVQQFCTASRDGGDSLSINCSEKKLKPVGRSCEGWITAGLDSIKLNCSGGLWVLNDTCKIEMRGANNGEINCFFN